MDASTSSAATGVSLQGLWNSANDPARVRFEPLHEIAAANHPDPGRASGVSELGGTVMYGNDCTPMSCACVAFEPRSVAAMITFPNGVTVPALGQGTWNMGDSSDTRDVEIDAIRTGIDLGLTVIDTAEMYGDGRSEELVGDAIRGRRDDVFLVSKVLPSNASVKKTVEACYASLDRLGTDRLDLYLLHWRGRYPVGETVTAFESLVADGSIRGWGVSNLDTSDLKQLPDGCQTDQVLYNLTRRGPEFDLLPWAASVGMPVMAYSPVEQGRLLTVPALTDIAHERGATPAQVALAWTMRTGRVLAIPKASTAEHVRENAAARDLWLTDVDLERLDRAFSPPRRPMPLEML